jgi:tRNA pseudouridine13 synthase
LGFLNCADWFCRNVQAESNEMIDKVMESMKTRGFINYYGMQRFGTASIASHTVGLALLQGKWAAAAELLLAIRPGEHPETVEARRLWFETKDAKAVVNLMPRRNVAERALLEYWARPTSRVEDAFNAILNVSLVDLLPKVY